jgi:hypothetical protein
LRPTFLRERERREGTYRIGRIDRMNEQLILLERDCDLWRREEGGEHFFELSREEREEKSSDDDERMKEEPK